jgi:hypothetical protein
MWKVKSKYWNVIKNSFIYSCTDLYLSGRVQVHDTNLSCEFISQRNNKPIMKIISFGIPMTSLSIQTAGNLQCVQNMHTDFCLSVTLKCLIFDCKCTRLAKNNHKSIFTPKIWKRHLTSGFHLAALLIAVLMLAWWPSANRIGPLGNKGCWWWQFS